MYHRFPVIIHSCIRESVKVTQLCPTLCNQARIPEWVAFPFSTGSSQPRDRIQVSCIADSLPSEPQGKSKNTEWVAYPFSSGSSWPRNWTRVSCVAGRFCTNWDMRKALILGRCLSISSLLRVIIMNEC